MRVGSTVAELNSPAPPTVNGELGRLIVGTWPDIEVVRLYWHLAQGRWISKPVRMLVSMNGTQFMQTAQKGYGYLTQSPSSGAPPYGWDCIRPVRKVKALMEAGLKLQDRISGRFGAGSVPGYVAIGFFTYSNGTPLSFTNDHTLVVHPRVTAAGAYTETTTTEGQTWTAGGGPTTLNVANAAAFIPSGTGRFITVEGIALVYAGITGNQFTGVALSTTAGGTTQKFGTFSSGAIVRQAFGTDYPMSPEGIGMSTVLVGDSTTSRFRQQPWTDVVLQVFNRNGEPKSPVEALNPQHASWGSIMKEDLYVTVYMTADPAATFFTSVSDLDYGVRWIS